MSDDGLAAFDDQIRQLTAVPAPFPTCDEALTDTFRYLHRQGVQLDRVIVALSEAKAAFFTDAIHEEARRNLRTNVGEGTVAQIEHHVDKIVELAHDVITPLNPDNLPITAAVVNDLRARLIDALDPTMTYLKALSLRRGGGRKRPSQPWLEQCRQRLQAAGVAPERIPDLLQAVGLSATD